MGKSLVALSQEGESLDGFALPGAEWRLCKKWAAEKKWCKIQEENVPEPLDKILVAKSTFEGTFYFSQALKVVDIPH